MGLGIVSLAPASVAVASEPLVGLVGTSGGNWPARWGLVEHWRLDENVTSGSALASVDSANALTDNNTVTSNPGKVYPTARQFTFANSEYLSLADNAALSTGAVDFWIAAWCYLDSASNNTFRLIASKEDDGTHREFSFYRDGSGNAFKLGVFNAAGTAIGSVLSTAGAPTAGAWYFVLAYYDAVNNLVKISVNGGAFDSGAVTGTPADTTASFRIGATNSTPSLFWDGRLGPVMFGKSPPLGIAALATEIRDRLYANGNGRAYPWR